MDMYTNSSAWLQQPQASQQMPESHSMHHEMSPPSSHDWKDPSSSVSSAPGSSKNGQATLDLSDYALGDIPGPSSTPSISPPAHSHYTGSFSQFPFYLSSVPGPYNVVPYGSPWAASSSQVPLSNYSTLDGATSPASTSQQLSPQQPNSSQQLLIDPVLTTANGSTSNGIQQYPQSPNLSLPSVPPPPSQQSPFIQYHYQHLHQQPLSINPAYVHSQYYQQQQSQQQGTLSPQALHSHSPPQSGTNTVAAQSFYAPMQSISPPAPTITPQMKKERLQTALKPLLQPASFTGAGAVQSLVAHLDEFGSQDVDAQLRSEILTKIRDNAGNHYFRAWSENPSAMDITREWLKAGYTGKADSQMVETIMPLLHIIDRLPFTLETLKTSRLGKIVVRLTKDPPNPAIKDMASNLERKWRQMVSQKEGTSKSEDNEIEDVKTKKRKSVEPPPKVAPPAKKIAVSTVSSSKPIVVKKETKPIVTSVKDAKSDSSFFSAPKPKPKLPSFKKAPVPVKKEFDINIAQPSAIDPFQEALKDMAKARKASPAAPTPPPILSSNIDNIPSTSSGLTKSGKKKKSVTWAPDSQLESIKLIERAIYDDDPADGMYAMHSVRDLERGEGAALHAHLFEEAIDWYEPSLIDDPIIKPRGTNSQEKTTQEEREQTALGALYIAAQIPESPAEPASQIPDDKVDADVKMMLVGPEVDAIFWSGGVPASIQPRASVADLVGQLTAGTDSSVNAAALPVDAQQTLDLSMLTSIPNLQPEQLQNLLQQAQAFFGQTQPPAAQPSYPNGESQDWNNNKQYSDCDQGYRDDDGGRERRWGTDQGWESRDHGRGRGRGRGRGDFRHSKRKPCSFFAQGRCKYGDQCDFSHEPSIHS